MGAKKVLAPLRPGLVAVPAIQPGICPVCRAAVKPGFGDCYVCDGSQVRVVPISMSVHSELLHHHLRNYKDGSAKVRPELTLRLAAMLEVFLRHHLESCLGGAVDLVATVPSVKRDAPWAIVERLRRFADQGSNPLAMEIDAHDFSALVADKKVKGRRVLLFDDTFTTGRSVFAANRTLATAGAVVVGPVVLGRHMRRSFAPSVPLLECLKSTVWKPSKCAICAGADCPSLIPSELFGE